MTLAQKKHPQTKIPSHNHNDLPSNSEYLSLIRRNHLKFQLEQKATSRLREVRSISCLNKHQEVLNDRRHCYDLQSDRKVDDQNDYGEENDLFHDKSSHKIFTSKDQLYKNANTIDVVPHAYHQKYHSLGDGIIVGTKRQGTNTLVNKNQEQNQTKPKIKQNLIDNEQLIYSFRKEITQKLLETVGKQQIHISDSPSIQKLNKDSLSINNKKAASELILARKQNDDQRKSTLLIKKQKIRDLWKQKFLNTDDRTKFISKSPEPKKSQSSLKFPNINISKMQRIEIKNNKTHDEKEQLNTSQRFNDCSLIRNSKPKLPKESPSKEIFVNNHSLLMINQSGFSRQKMKKHLEHLSKKKLNKLSEWQANLSKVQSKKMNNHPNQSQLYNEIQQDINSSMIYSNNNSAASFTKRRKSHPRQNINITQLTYATEGGNNSIQLHSSYQIKNRPKNHKQINRQKEKEVQTYLKNNSFHRNASIINHYENQEQKKKLLFDEIQKYYCDIFKEQKMFSNGKKCNLSRNKSPLEQNKLQLSPTISQKKQILNYVESRSNDVINQVQNLSTQQPLNAGNNTSLVSIQKKKGPSINSFRKQTDLSIYQMKIRSYRQFIFMMNLNHKVFSSVTLKPPSQAKNSVKFTYYIGKGNNRLLIKSLMNRRFWWQETKELTKANFVWTQLKLNELYKYQKVSEYATANNRFDKVEECSNNAQKKVNKKKNSSKGPQKAGSYKAPLPESSEMKIFSQSDKEIYEKMISSQSQTNQDTTKMNYNNRLKYLPSQTLNTTLTQESLHNQKVHNHLQFNFFIGNKKALFYNLQNYYQLLGKDVFSIIPYTLHIKKGVQDPAYKTFLREYKKIAKEQPSNGLKNIWIVKPGQLSNRGQGITVIDEVYELNNIMKKKQKHKSGAQKSYILQKYIQKPLLFKNRKFDIRHYVLLSRFHGRFRAYFYGQGYIRTSSKQYKLDELDEMIHLTNDAIQKQGNSYGKHEDGNKVSYTEFQRYLDSTFGENKHNFAQEIYPKMKNIALDSIKATYTQLDPSRLQHNFQLLGLDFMIDNKFNVWLIQVNTNPCLELSSKLLERIIPQMTENVLRLCIDPMFPPPTHFPNSLKHLCPDSPLERLQYELIFDQARDGKEVEQLFRKCNLKQLYKDMGEVDQEDATFENDGNEIEFKNQKGQDNQ